MEKITTILKSRNAISYFWTLAGQNSASLFQLINNYVIISALGHDNNGRFILAQTYCLFITSLISFQTFNGVIKYTYDYKEKGEVTKTKQCIKVSFIIDLISGLLAILIGVVLLRPFSMLMNWEDSFIPYCNILIVFYVLKPIMGGTSIGILRIKDRFDIIGKVMLACNVAKLLLFIVTSLINAKLIVYIVIDGLFELICGIVIIYESLILCKNDKFMDMFWKEVTTIDKGFAKMCIYSGSTLSFDLLIGNASTFLVERYLGYSAVSIMQCIERLYGIFSKFASPLNQIIYPKMCLDIAKGDYKSAYAKAKKFMIRAFPIGLAIIVPILVTYKLWMSIFIPDPTPYFLISAIYTVMTIYVLSATNYGPLAISIGLQREVFIFTMITDIVYFGLLYFGISKFEIIGCLALKSIQAVVVTTIKIAMCKRKMKRILIK